jgi:hypothetical protein
MARFKKGPLLLRRKIRVEGISPYGPKKHLEDTYKSIVKVQYVYTLSAFGNWTGYFIQRIGVFHYLVPFSQQNDNGAFILTTAERFFRADRDINVLEKAYIAHVRITPADNIHRRGIADL